MRPKVGLSSPQSLIIMQPAATMMAVLKSLIILHLAQQVHCSQLQETVFTRVINASGPGKLLRHLGWQ